jgi:hypothetical protein
MVTANTPAWAAGDDLVTSVGSSKCGLKVATHLVYQNYPPSYAQQAPAIIAQLKAAGVTTVLQPDLDILPTLMAAADKQSYYPEWVSFSEGSAVTTFSGPADQLAHWIGIGPVANIVAPSAQTAWAAYAVEKPGQHPAETQGNQADNLFYNLLTIFNGIQMAGPDLTPVTFGTGLERLPAVSGPYGLWYGNHPGFQDVQQDYVVSIFNPAEKSPGGTPGTMVACDGGTRILYNNPTNLGSGQLQCPRM